MAVLRTPAGALAGSGLGKAASQNSAPLIGQLPHGQPVPWGALLRLLHEKPQVPAFTFAALPGSSPLVLAVIRRSLQKPTPFGLCGKS